MNRVLILEPAKSVRKSLCDLIEIDGFEAIGVDSLSHCQEELESAQSHHSPFDLLIYNVESRPSSEGFFTVPSIAISDNPSVEEASQTYRSGACDYISRPFDLNRLMQSVRSSMKRVDVDAKEKGSNTKQVNSRAKRASRRSTQCGAEPSQVMVGKSSAINKLREMICRIAPYDVRVMILGENGTGKELVARNIHNLSPRANSPFVEVNCAAIPSELIESELFGHEKGAFTSAVKQRHGKFEQASGGTLFLDEIGDMSLSAQAKVLRALQECKISRVGSDVDIDVDVRVLAATNKDIRAEIAAGNFREDLYHRLSVIELNVTALRNRAEDIPLLIDHFMREICAKYNIECKSIDSDAMERLKGLRWSGNIRELRNVVERLVVLCGEKITVEDVALLCH